MTKVGTKLTHMNTLNNQVHLIGRLGQEPKLTKFDNGNAVCRFSLATHEFYKDKKGERQQRTDWHTVVAWGKMAEVMSDLLQKGKQVVVSGKLKNRQYEDKNGNNRYTTEVVASDFLLVGPRESAEAAVAEENLPF